jgi:hypothetical protein
MYQYKGHHCQNKSQPACTNTMPTCVLLPTQVPPDSQCTAYCPQCSPLPGSARPVSVPTRPTHAGKHQSRLSLVAPVSIPRCTMRTLPRCTPLLCCSSLLLVSPQLRLAPLSHCMERLTGSLAQALVTAHPPTCSTCDPLTHRSWMLWPTRTTQQQGRGMSCAT